METLIVILIVALASLFTARILYNQLKGKGGCSGGCSCSLETQNRRSEDIKLMSGCNSNKNSSK